MKKLARTTRYHTIRSSQLKAKRLSGRIGHFPSYLGIFDRWLIGLRKWAPMKINSVTGGARPNGRENQKYL